MTPEQAKALRVPFPTEVVGKLPRIWCKRCSEANKQNGGTCDQHGKSRCGTCRNNITSAHLHLDYVGHAEVTDRFLEVDPEWEWQPLAFDADGLPKFDATGGLWIKLTIGGVTRLGYGDAQGKKGADAVKETIGDALRNGGLRFGVAIDLWGATFKGSDDGDTGETHGRDSEGSWESAQPAAPPAKPTREQIVQRGLQTVAAAPSAEVLASLRDRVDALALAGDITTEDAVSMHAAINGREIELQSNVNVVAPELVGTSA